MSRDAVIHLIDDDEGVRQALAFLLATAGFAVRVYPSALDFLAALPGVQPGCVVTDVRMPGMDGLELQRQLNARQIGLPVIVMTGHGDVPLAVEAMKAGAVDFIEKPFHEEILLNALSVAIERHAQHRSDEGEATTIRSRLDSLSAREVQVLEGLVAGHPNKTIAYDLKLSVRTVEAHRASLTLKMGAAGLSDLVRMVFVARGVPVDDGRR